ncbi:MAG: BON domain-containing protein [Gammaproteobacteria bacterium]|jgi:osmotically-inducible protein OsmY|uniref:BON domain-containing protein n=1 Tax=Pseudomonas sp. 9Ag TaxID=2653167 RepID=UPI0012F05F77|nr:BON domain-containing protein [Pseudomonas sp. 9Ag]MBU1301398.1 BON domain-containing protein [Gammaproteobacteria bacterium]MBU1458394.1 BON domain-containing protein [Gammaproteobacteria bacterium]MBU2282806.1 BON domain-containing protein [Gammaproteobacteria bacterium]MBU2371216.1 BON domain-containing protein [Gammaproteobacteria bacterium]VXC29343.1 Phospholipid-binding protein [Pseudomonas sp. 9Ag]|tara:strand:+ start:1846 stop:2424 length:579 start_codon:yes stop_codon:yes gene_type:complete
MTSVHLHTLTLALCLVVTGCGSVLNATRDEPINDNRGTRTIGSTIDDSLIETKAAVNIAKAHPDLDQASHIVVASYNGVVLLAGQTPRAELKQLAEQAASSVQRVKRVHNEVQVLKPSSGLARSNDSWLTTKIKAQMLADASVPGSRIKVITENGIVYLLGLVTRQEGNRATSVVQGVSGVQRIVKLFEYID